MEKGADLARAPPPGVGADAADGDTPAGTLSDTSVSLTVDHVIIRPPGPGRRSRPRHPCGRPGGRPGEKRRFCRLSKRLILCIVVGQIMSIISVIPGTCTTYLSDMGVSVPLFQDLILYGAFQLFWVVPTVHRFSVRRRMDLLYFGLVGIIDLTANALSFFAFAYTSVAAVLLLMCLSTPSALLFSVIIRRRKFSWLQVFFALAATGSGILFTYIDNIGATGGSKLSGNIMSTFTGILFGLEAVLNEYITVDYNVPQYLARMGVSGTVGSLIVFLAIEYDYVVVSGVFRKGMVWAYLMGYLVSFYVFYLLMPWVIGNSNAIVYNVSFLTANVYSFIVSAGIMHVQFSLWVILPVFLLIGSLVGYFGSPASEYCCSVKPRAVRLADRAARGAAQATAGDTARATAKGGADGDARTGAGAGTGTGAPPATELESPAVLPDGSQMSFDLESSSVLQLTERREPEALRVGDHLGVQLKAR